MSFILTLIVYLIVLGLLWYLIQMLPLPAPVKMVINVLGILFLILIVLSVTGILPGGHFPLVHLNG